MKRSAIHAAEKAMQGVFRAARAAISPPPRAAKRRRREDDLTPRITQNAMPPPPRTFLSEAELAAELSTSAPRLARARAAGRIRHDAVCARGCSRLYARERLAELRAALTK